MGKGCAGVSKHREQEGVPRSMSEFVLHRGVCSIETDSTTVLVSFCPFGL